jgi:protein TonB
MFDQYVERRRNPATRRTLALASIALHGAAAIGLCIWSFAHVEEIAPPMMMVTFFNAPPPPPPPPPPAGSGHKAERKKPVEVKPKQIVMPTEVPHTLTQPQKKEEPEEKDDEGEAGGVQGGVKGGVAGGVVGGTLGGTVGGVIGGQIGGTAPATVKPKNVPPHALDSQALYKPDPHLPDAIKLQRRGTGDAVFMCKLCVAQDGSIMRVDVMQGIPGADENITSTLRQWRFKPQPIPVCMMTRFEFAIQ